MTNWLYGRTRICNGQPTGIIETRLVGFFDVFADGVGLEAGDFFFLGGIMLYMSA